MVVASTICKLLVLLVDALSDCVRLSEIERCSGHVGITSDRNQVLVNRSGPAGIDGHHVVENGAFALALEVEERMVREVDVGRGIGAGPVGHDKLIVGSEFVFHSDDNVARIAVLPVRMDITQENGCGIRCNHIPNDHIKSFQPAVKGLAVVVLRQGVCRAVNFDLTSGKTVGIRPHTGTEETLSVVVHIFVDVVIAKDDILHPSLPVRGPEGHDTGSEIGHLHSQVSVGECVETDRLPVDLGRKILLRKELYALITRTGCQEGGNRQKCKIKFFHIRICLFSMVLPPKKGRIFNVAPNLAIFFYFNNGSVQKQ